MSALPAGLPSLSTLSAVPSLSALSAVPATSTLPSVTGAARAQLVDDAGRLSQLGIALAGSGRTVDGVRRALESAGAGEIRTVPCEGGELLAERLDLCVVATDSPSAGPLLELNARCLDLGVPLLPGLALGSTAMVGPLVRGGAGPCLRCVEMRLLAATGRSCLKTYGPADASMAKRIAEEIVARVASADDAEASRWLTFCPPGGHSSRHPVLRTRRCPDCAHLGVQPAYRGRRAFEFRDRQPAAPGKIIGLRDRLVDPVTGPITSLTEYHPAPPSPPLHHVVTTLADDGWQAAGYETVSCGGASLERQEAEAAALGEAVERSSAVLPRRAELVLAPYEEIAERSVDPGAWDLFVAETRAEHGFPYRRPSSSEVISWTWGWSLTTSRPVLVPASRVFLALDSPLPGDFPDCSLLSGFAVAPSLEEATLRGLLEVIERDAFMVAWANRLSLRHLPLAKAGPSATAFRQAGLEVRCGLVELDLGAPVAIAMARSTQPGDPAFVVAAAAGLSPGDASRRALNELAANRLHVRHCLSQAEQHGPPPREARDETAHGLLYARAEMLAEVGFWWEGSDGESDVTAESCPAASLTPWRQISSLVETIGRAGLEVLVVDLTAPEIGELGLHAVKVLVPGAYPMNFDSRWPHFGGRRLAQAPVEAGLRDDPLSISQLNRVPHPFP